MSCKRMQKYVFMQLARKMREKHRSNGRFSLSERHESIRRPILRQMDEFDALVDLVKNLKIVVLGNTGTGKPQNPKTPGI